MTCWVVPDCKHLRIAGLGGVRVHGSEGVRVFHKLCAWAEVSRQPIKKHQLKKNSPHSVQANNLYEQHQEQVQAHMYIICKRNQLHHHWRDCTNAASGTHTYGSGAICIQVTAGLPDALVEFVSQWVMQQVDASFNELTKILGSTSSSSTASTLHIQAPPRAAWFCQSASLALMQQVSWNTFQLVACYCWAVRVVEFGVHCTGLPCFRLFCVWCAWAAENGINYSSYHTLLLLART